MEYNNFKKPKVQQLKKFHDFIYLFLIINVACCDSYITKVVSIIGPVTLVHMKMVVKKVMSLIVLFQKISYVTYVCCKISPIKYQDNNLQNTNKLTIGKLNDMRKKWQQTKHVQTKTNPLKQSEAAYLTNYSSLTTYTAIRFYLFYC